MPVTATVQVLESKAGAGRFGGTRVRRPWGYRFNYKSRFGSCVGRYATRPVIAGALV